MKVAFILRKFPVLSETFILEQIVGLIDQGIEVDIFSLFRGSLVHRHSLIDSYNLIEKVNFPKISCPSKALTRFLKLPLQFKTSSPANTIQKLKSLNFLRYKHQALFLNLLYFSTMFNTVKSYDVIHCHFGMYGLIGVDLKDLNLISGKIITSFHGMDIHVYPKTHGVSVYRRLFSQGDMFTVNSNYTRNCLVRLGCPREKIFKLPVGLRTEKYASQADKHSHEKIRILTVARLVEKKGLEYGIKAIADLHPQLPDIQYDIVGEGALRDSLSELIKTLKATDYIRLLGPRNQSDLRQLYSNADIFLLPSVTATDGDMEGQGLVLQEAQASGIPIVSTLHNGIPEGVIADKSGFLVPEKDVDALAESLKKLITQPQLRKEMGEAGKLFVQHSFDIERLNGQLLNLYKRVL